MYPQQQPWAALPLVTGKEGINWYTTATHGVVRAVQLFLPQELTFSAEVLSICFFLQSTVITHSSMPLHPGLLHVGRGHPLFSRCTRQVSMAAEPACSLPAPGGRGWSPSRGASGYEHAWAEG